MEPRRSRRLRGLLPEEQIVDQVCFICQLGIDINSLTRCKPTPCCGVLLHRQCQQEMVTRVQTCGNCRHVHATGEEEIILETDEELEDDPFEMPEGTILTNRINVANVARELNDYRNDTRYLYTHFNGSVFWNIVPYEVDPGIWLDYYRQLELFTRLFPRMGLFIHRRVTLPREATREVRNAVYKMFLYNTPFSVFDMTKGFRFSLLFVRDASSRSLQVDPLCVLPFPGGPSLYHHDDLWTWHFLAAQPWAERSEVLAQPLMFIRQKLLKH